MLFRRVLDEFYSNHLIEPFTHSGNSFTLLWKIANFFIYIFKQLNVSLAKRCIKSIFMNLKKISKKGGNMKLINLTIILMTTIATGALAQEKKTVLSTLKEATVFFQGSELTHEATSPLTKGVNEVYLEGLSPNIDINSLKIKTTNGVVVSTYEFSVDYLSTGKKEDPQIKKLQESITENEKTLEQINTDISITGNLLALLQKGTEKNVDGSEKGLGIDELMKTMDYYKSKSKELHDMQAANNRKKTELQENITKWKEQLNQESVKNNKTSGILKLSLSSPIDASCQFVISYYTPYASWMPYYDINVISTDKPIQIASKARVRQTTGMDWEKVKLTLSTSTPSNGKIAPLFHAWFLEAYHPAPAPRAMRPSLIQNAYSYNKADMPMEMEEEKMAEMSLMQEPVRSSLDNYITQADNELNTVYSIDIPYNIPGNGKEQSIDLQTKETTADYKYYCAPKLDTETYLLAEIANWQELNLLSGPANITYDGTYVGESYIDARSTQENLSLTLGTDKRVSVKREKLQDFSSTRPLGSDTKQVFAYKITVRNNQNKPVKMVLKDQYPISTQKNIEVELLKKETTPWTANVEEMGVVTWEGELPAGETKVYQISYSVKYPKGVNLNL